MEEGLEVLGKSAEVMEMSSRNTSRNNGSLVVTVLLSNGGEQNHIYDIPVSEFDETMDVLKPVLNVFTRILGNVRNSAAEALLLGNPLTIYNPDQVLGIKFSVQGPARLQEVFEQFQQTPNRFLRDHSIV